MKHSHKQNGNIIFLDIDGVLTSNRLHRTVKNRNSRIWTKFDPVAIDFFNIMYFHHDISFVICSSWRNHFNTKELKHMLYAAGFQGEILCCTKEDNHTINKPKAIQMYVEENKPKNWLVVDDECKDWIGNHDIFQDSNTINTCSINGLLAYNMDKFEKIVNKWNNP